jgi:L-seryl-tRNA(Ser) seleniumtransferase
LAQVRRLLPLVTAAFGGDFSVDICSCESQIGSGALPLSNIPSAGFAVRSLSRAATLERLVAQLRDLPTPVIGRIEDDALKLDLRCLEDEKGFLSVLAELNAAHEGDLR